MGPESTRRQDGHRRPGAGVWDTGAGFVFSAAHCPWALPLAAAYGHVYGCCVCTGTCMPGRVRVCMCACTALVPGGRSLLRGLDPPSVTAQGWGWAQGTHPPQGPCTSLPPVPGTSPHLTAVLGHLQPCASLSSPRRAPRAPSASPGSAAPNPTRPAATQLFGTAAPKVGSRATLGYAVFLQVVFGQYPASS